MNQEIYTSGDSDNPNVWDPIRYTPNNLAPADITNGGSNVGSVQIRSVAPSLAVSAHARELDIILRVIRLIITMIDILNIITATQSKKVQVLADMQGKYNDMINVVDQIMEKKGTDGGFIDFIHNQISTQPTGKNATQRRVDMNALGASWLEVVKNKRSLIQDDSKKVTTAVNQSNDVSNQQTSMSSSLLQQLSTILAAIFR